MIDVIKFVLSELRILVLALCANVFGLGFCLMALLSKKGWFSLEVTLIFVVAVILNLGALFERISEKRS